MYKYTALVEGRVDGVAWFSVRIYSNIRVDDDDSLEELEQAILAQGQCGTDCHIIVYDVEEVVLTGESKDEH